MIKNPKLLTKSFLRSFAILGGVGLVIHIAIYLTFPFYYIQLEGEKFNESARVFTEYLKTKTSDEIPSLLQSYYGFKPVFLVEKNKKTTSYAGG
ncbi:signal transduction histidine kinase [Streptococcus pneumoniae]|nr:signal transduction histidine kinase [Streptococcus pneumoniae]VPG93435.1 signal transduction histidine kinase [Streptococcus pneumoniae]